MLQILVPFKTKSFFFFLILLITTDQDGSQKQNSLRSQKVPGGGLISCPEDPRICVVSYTRKAGASQEWTQLYVDLFVATAVI